MKVMRAVVAIVGGVMALGSGLAMFIFWFKAMYLWLGIIGAFLAFILCPGVVIFPIIFWIVEGVFPVAYFIYWGVGVIGVVILGISRLNNE